MILATRILVAKPGIDEHDSGVRLMSHRFKKAGMEVIYTGLKQSPDQIVATVLQEDVDALGISILLGDYKKLLTEIITLLKEKDLFKDLLVFVGGIIAEEDIPLLKEMGIAEVFLPGTDLNDVVEFVNQHIKIDRG